MRIWTTFTCLQTLSHENVAFDTKHDFLSHIDTTSIVEVLYSTFIQKFIVLQRGYHHARRLNKMK